MPMIMFVIGCVAIMAGVVMIAFGIPISEFSFGNTLIVSGTTLATGGLVILALSTVARQLARLAEGQGLRMPAPPPRQAAESFEPPPEARPAPARVPFPPKPSLREALNAEPPMPPDLGRDLGYDEPSGPSFAPSMRNPEAPPASVEDEVSLSPPAPTNGSAGGEPHEPGFEGWRPEPPAPPPLPRESPGSYFDSMWPAKPRTAAAPAAPETAKAEPPAHERESVARVPAEPAPQTAPGKAAVLKSGVVDGMAYTLYVDGSIEAELPQGTLRFASIDDLRSHLEKSG